MVVPGLRKLSSRFLFRPEGIRTNTRVVEVSLSMKRLRQVLSAAEKLKRRFVEPFLTCVIRSETKLIGLDQYIDGAYYSIMKYAWWNLRAILSRLIHENLRTAESHIFCLWRACLGSNYSACFRTPIYGNEWRLWVLRRYMARPVSCRASAFCYSLSG